MLTSFYISNFRLFKTLEIEKLSRVNLFVGKNNSGKSALLEAIRLYASNGQPEVLLDCVASRQEYWRPQVEAFRAYHTADNIGYAIRHLFNGRHLPDIDEEGLRVGPLNPSKKQIHITLAAYRDERIDEGIVSRRVKKSDVENDDSNLELTLIKEINEQTIKLINLNQEMRGMIQFPHRLRRTDSIHYPTQTVSTREMHIDKIAALWDATNLTELEPEVINGLRLLEPHIKSIAFVRTEDGRGHDERIPLVKYEGIAEPLPLRSMGDGIFRIFNIVLALVNARNGMLIIDEFENGLHWSVQPEIWDIIFRLSQRLNVQVFASTHSLDCVKGFQKTWCKESETSGGLFRLDITPKGAKATAYNLETLSDAIDVVVEVR